MRIVVGSLNKTKVNAVKDVFLNDKVISVEVPSYVLSQPIGDEMTLQGAINRAVSAQKNSHGGIGIGVEGGVMFLNGDLYLTNWGALVTEENHVITAGGVRIKLPESFKQEILKGEELSHLMEHFTKKKDIRTNEGAIGIFTDGLLLRKEMYAQVCLLLKGQYDYWKKYQKLTNKL